jgi:hypothetical protein
MDPTKKPVANPEETQTIVFDKRLYRKLQMTNH